MLPKKEVCNDLEMIFDVLMDGVFVLDANARFLYVNKYVWNNLDVRESYFLGKTPQELIDEGFMDKTVVYEAMTTKREVRGMIRLANGEELMSCCVPVFEKDGALKYLVSTVTPMTAIARLRQKLEEKEQQSAMYRREAEHLRRHLLVNHDFICESPSMRTVVETVRKVASMDCTVLITGESGVGKEVIAKIIHVNSARKDAPFIPVSIPAIPENLLESELFGFEEGAFTGSKKGGKPGLFEIAQDGTLFLDEVGDIPPTVQVKLLRAIETGEITRVGGIRSYKFNFRIIAATNKDVEAEVKKGNFRDDLYYRLNIVPIRILPLRERPEDIWPLSSYFLAKMNKKYGMRKEFSRDALACLKEYPWTGNIRELRNVVERLAILSNHETIAADDLRGLLGFPVVAAAAADDVLREYESFERSRLLAALKEADGNKSKAARLLGMTRTKLYRKLKMNGGHGEAERRVP